MGGDCAGGGGEGDRGGMLWQRVVAGSGETGLGLGKSGGRESPAGSSPPRRFISFRLFANQLATTCSSLSPSDRTQDSSQLGEESDSWFKS